MPGEDFHLSDYARFQARTCHPYRGENDAGSVSPPSLSANFYKLSNILVQ